MNGKCRPEPAIVDFSFDVETLDKRLDNYGIYVSFFYNIHFSNVPRHEDSSAALWLIQIAMSKSWFSEAVYCYCRKPDTGSFMVQCDACQEW